jgi:UDP-N-acetylglucosamine:LPS N-acetylglucosamine transferase
MDGVTNKKKGPPLKVLAVASGGGHWIQLLRLMPALTEHELAFVTTLSSNRAQVGGSRFYTVRDASRWNKAGLCFMAAKVLWILMQERPSIIISTGAAPGYFALRLGKLLGAKTIWVDSIANAQKISMSGTKIGKYADLWLTQWPHLARDSGPHFRGAVL